MFFYKIEANLVEADETKRKQEDQAVVFQTKAEKAFLASGKNCYIFISGMRRDKLICGVIARTPDNMERAMPVFMKQLGFQTKTTKVSEITMKSLISLANRADRNNYIEDSDELLAHFDLDDIDCGHRSLFSEYILDEPRSLAQLKKLAKGLPGERGLIEELDRVFAFPKPSVKGHPVHYIVRAEDKPARMKTMDILLSALFSSGRIASRRCCTIDWPSRWSDIGSQLELLYASSIDGVVAFDCKEDTLGDEEDRQILLNCMRKHKNRVLTVLCLSDDDYPVMQKLRGFSMLELREDRLCKDNAKRYLRRMAQAQGTMATKELYQSIGNEGSGYRPSELDRMFDVWFEQRLKTEWFPQYADIGAARCGMERKDAGSAYAQLQNMIGLSEAKAVIDQALDFFKLQRMRAAADAVSVRPAMHMVFTGNPGTAKTTVARLFAQIMKENDLLPSGELHEVGRADLVGKYVGWTAKIVKERFREARGGVLFIDEAYSLAEEKGGLYGDEAINTIVQEMENHRNDTVVIFAGYPDKMEAFLARNPGLRSRIAFHVPFPDYSAEELYQICGLIAGQRGLSLDSGTKAALVPIMERVREQGDFGNGRFARNLIEKAQMRQASRLMKMDANSVTARQISTLAAEDFDIPEMQPRQIKRRIGFALA